MLSENRTKGYWTNNKRNNSIAHILSFGQILGRLDNSTEYLRYTLSGYSGGWLDHSLATLPYATLVAG